MTIERPGSGRPKTRACGWDSSGMADLRRLFQTSSNQRRESVRMSCGMRKTFVGRMRRMMRLGAPEHKEKARAQAGGTPAPQMARMAVTGEVRDATDHQRPADRRR